MRPTPLQFLSSSRSGFFRGRHAFKVKSERLTRGEDGFSTSLSLPEAAKEEVRCGSAATEAGYMCIDSVHGTLQSLAQALCQPS